MAAKFGLIIFALFVAGQVSGSPCYYSAPQTSYCGSAPAPTYSCGASTGYNSGASQSATQYLIPQGGSSCGPSFALPANYLSPIFPNFPTLSSPNPLTVPLPLPSVIPVGRVSVSKAIQIQPTLLPVQKQCSCACQSPCN